MAGNTYKKPFVYDETTGKQRLLAAGETVDTGQDVIVQEVNAGASVAAGAPVSTVGSGLIDETDATSASDSCHYLGIACEAGGAGADVGVVTDGPITLPTATWDAITGEGPGGLTPGQEYWVDPASPGDLTSTPPSPTASVQYVIRVGHALTADTMMVDRPHVFGI